MDKPTIATLYEYGIWANRKLIDQARALTDAQLRQPFTQHEFSILGSFAHLVSAEWRWLQAWQGAPMMDALTVADLPTVDAVVARWEPLWAERRAFIANLGDDWITYDVRRTIAGREIKIPLWQALIHVANHGMQHRSEIALMLTEVGHSPGDLDMLGYFLGR
jgi:uncharacterized damage-inducible protein DinB